jgi:hypothetical protein
MQKLVRANGTGGWLTEDVPFNALYNSLGQLTSFTAVGSFPVIPWGHLAPLTMAQSGLSQSPAGPAPTPPPR